MVPRPKNWFVELKNSDESINIPLLANLSDMSSEDIKPFRREWVEQDVGLRQCVTTELCELAKKNVDLNFDSIFWNCMEDGDPTVRSKAIEGLWECEDCRFISRLIELLLKDDSESVRVAAATALGKFALLAELRNIPARYTTRISDALFAVIDDKEEKKEVRQRAIEAVAPLNLSRVRQIIKNAYREKDPQLRASAIYAMGRHCDRQYLPILLKELRSRNPDIRLQAINACGELGEGEAVPSLVKLLNNPDTRVKQAVIESLKQIGGNEAKEALMLLNHHPGLDAQLRQAVEDAMKELALEDDILDD